MGSRISDKIQEFIAKFEKEGGNDVYVKEGVKLYSYRKHLLVSKGEAVKLESIGITTVTFVSYRDNEEYTLMIEHFLDDIKHFETKQERRKRIIEELCK